QRIDVQDQDRLARIPWLEERVNVRDVGLGVPHRRADVRRVVVDRDRNWTRHIEMVGHSPYLLCTVVQSDPESWRIRWSADSAFVQCRVSYQYGDGRHPDQSEPKKVLKRVISPASRRADLVALGVDHVPTAAELDGSLAFDLACRMVACVVIERVAVVGQL